ncbi:hypothetical protein LGN17_19790 [Burkholderia sp. AU30280]|uniref:hypothetical protein n=1 Tax=Burkholderia sp. AU30280 TaxID=2879628 RepID=UPI001CF4595F|nr:hypothetical protein [Burkholderia sp. AU30280]MCA8274732.1 hypothetical protein [Burkholderia sp. AU30280]
MNGAARYPQVMHRSRHCQRGAVAIVAGLAPAATMPPFTTTLPRESLTFATGGANRN